MIHRSAAARAAAIVAIAGPIIGLGCAFTGTAAAGTAGTRPGAPGIGIKETRHRVKVTGPGFVVKVDRHGIDARINDAEFGDPSTGNPIQRSTVNLTGLTLRPFECANGTYTIRTGTFERTFRVSQAALRPPPFPPGFAAAFPGINTPFVGVLDGTVTNAEGETLRFYVSDIALEILNERGFAATAPIHGFFVDESGRVRDRISLTGYFNSGPGGANARYFIKDRGTCRQRADLQWPGSENSVVTGPIFVFPFSAPLVVPRHH